MKQCHACKKELDLGRNIGRRDVCPFCREDLSCCLNCRFFAPSASRQCSEPAADAVKDKGRANFCVFFVFAEQSEFSAPSDGVSKARRELDELFKA